MKEQCVRQRRPVAVATAHGFREPHELAAGSARPSYPTTITPVERRATQRPVMLASTRRTAGALTGHVDFINDIEPIPCHRGQNTAHARREANAGEHAYRRLTSIGLEAEERLNIFDAIARRDAWSLRRNGSSHSVSMTAARRSDNQRRQLLAKQVPLGDRSGVLAQRLSDCRCPRAVNVGENDIEIWIGRYELASGTSPNCTNTKNAYSGPWQRQSMSSSRQPPV